MVDRSVTFLTIKEQAQLIRDRKLSPVELTELYLRRIERLDNKLHAFNALIREQALVAARQAEQEIRAGCYRGPMHGIPVAVKDVMNIAGVPDTGGSHVYADNIPTEDATVVAKLKQAGAVLLGTLSTHEFGMGTTLRFLKDTPRNPWDLDLTPGGSSSGSASSVAAGLVSGSLGCDAAGSIRIPASFCNIAGLSPSWSRVSRHGIFSLSWSQDRVGPLARSAEDCAIMLQVLAGYDPKDPTTTRQPVPDYTAQLDGDILGLRIGAVKEMMDESEDETRQAVERAIGVLEELGARVERVSIPLMDQIRLVHLAVVDAEAASYHRPKLLERYHDFDYNTRVRLMVGAILPSSIHTLARRARALIGKQVLDIFEKFDVLVGPTSLGGATGIRTETGIQGKEDAANLLRGAGTVLKSIIPYSMAGVPAISIPCGFNSQGLPLGFHLAARWLDEVTLFKVCHAYQQVTTWHEQYPPMIWTNAA